jgi:hypothetical protein
MGVIALLAIAAFAVLVFVGRGYSLRARYWRLISSVVAVALLVTGGFLCLRGAWPIGLILTVIGGLTALSARVMPAVAAPPPRTDSSIMSESEARSLLGVADDATRDQIEAAYLRVMKRAHPDQGGTSGLASKVNAARERLLRGR